VEDVLEKIRATREAIWLQEPTDIARLRTKKGARNQGASAVLFADIKLMTLITFLNHVRGIARQGGVDLETMKRMTDSYLALHANSLGGFFELTDTAQVLHWGQEALAQVQSLEEYVDVMSELALYLGRMEYWVDMLIPWARFGQVYEEVSRQAA